MDPEEITPEQREAIEKELREQLESEISEKLQKQFAEENKETLDKIADEKLSKMKENIDKAYAKLDEMTRENTRLKEKTKEDERKRLEEQGKHLELEQMKTAELEERNKILEERLTGLTRDSELNRHLSKLEFKSDAARDTAFNTLVGQLTQTDDGEWKHKSGASIEDYMKVFVKDPNYEFFFKPKDNRGTGANPSNVNGSNKRPDSLQDLDNDQILELARSGQLGSFSFG